MRGTIYNPAAQLPLPGLTGQGIGFLFNADEEPYHSVARALYPGGVDHETVSRGAGQVHQFNTYTVSPAQAAAVYGAQLDLVAADGRAYRWSGKVIASGNCRRARAGRCAPAGARRSTCRRARRISSAWTEPWRN